MSLCCTPSEDVPLKANRVVISQLYINTHQWFINHEILERAARRFAICIVERNLIRLIIWVFASANSHCTYVCRSTSFKICSTPFQCRLVSYYTYKERLSNFVQHHWHSILIGGFLWDIFSNNVGFTIIKYCCTPLTWYMIYRKNFGGRWYGPPIIVSDVIHFHYRRNLFFYLSLEHTHIYATNFFISFLQYKIQDYPFTN